MKKIKRSFGWFLLMIGLMWCHWLDHMEEEWKKKRWNKRENKHVY